MARKMFITTILVAFTSLIQYGCKSTEATQVKADNDQTQVAAEDTVQAKEATVIGARNLVIASAEIGEIQAETAVSIENFVVRVDCGGTEKYTDKAGNVWQPDQEKTANNKWGAVYGQTIGRPDLGIEGTNCPIIYESERYSMDAYEFAVPAGKYTVTLHFAETYEGISGVGERVFGVSINGNEVLKNMDPYKEAGEFNKPAVKKFDGIEPKDGKIVIGFTPGVENPQICGIEIVAAGSEAAPAGGEGIAIRVNCGTAEGTQAYTDQDGKVWQPDRLMAEGLDWGAADGEVIQRSTLAIKDTKSPTIYQSETYSMSAYKFKVPAGKYIVKLHFAETYEGISGAGQRVFDVSINGKKVIEKLDPYKEAGAFAKPVVKEFNDIEPADGVITIGFTPGVENPQICGIEVLSQGVVKVAPSGEKFAVRVNCGTAEGTQAYTDQDGKVWQPDRLMAAGLDWGAADGEVIQRSTLAIKDTKSPTIYQSETYSMSAYKFKVTAGKYIVRLHFAETYEGISGAGQRVFDVSINGKKVIEKLDPYKEAGAFAKPVVYEFKDIEPADGLITIGFTSGVENPQICGIEVIAQ
jgi:hypothetical protein